MKLNDFIRELTALCKEEANPEVTDLFGDPVRGVDYVDGDIILFFTEEDDITPEDSIEPDEPEEDAPVLKIV
jgi:hypothetical protein